MKKIIALLSVIVVMFSCSTDDNGSNNITNPPNNDLRLTRMDLNYVDENTPYFVLVNLYDASGRVDKITAYNSNTPSETFVSDYEYQDGRVVNINYSNGTNRTYTYQGDQIISSELNGTTWAYGYDTFGRLETITMTMGGSTSCVTTYTYGNSSQPSESLNDCTGNTTTYAYDNKKNPQYYLFHASFSKIAPLTPNNIASTAVTGPTDESGYTTTITYNEQGWPTAIQYFNNGEFMNTSRFYYE